MGQELSPQSSFKVIFGTQLAVNPFLLFLGTGQTASRQMAKNKFSISMAH